MQEVKTRLLICIPQQLMLKKTSLPSDHKLKRLGIEFLRKDEPRVARYKGKIYFEGTEIEKIDFCNGYKTYLFGVTGQNQYKLGHTRSVKRRVKEVLGNSPFQIEVINYITTPAAKIVEEEIRALFSKFISAKEWLMLYHNLHNAK